jgi:hypothetical protein
MRLQHKDLARAGSGLAVLPYIDYMIFFNLLINLLLNFFPCAGWVIAEAELRVINCK